MPPLILFAILLPIVLITILPLIITDVISKELGVVAAVSVLVLGWLAWVINLHRKLGTKPGNRELLGYFCGLVAITFMVLRSVGEPQYQEYFSYAWVAFAGAAYYFLRGLEIGAGGRDVTQQSGKHE